MYTFASTDSREYYKHCDEVEWSQPGGVLSEARVCVALSTAESELYAAKRGFGRKYLLSKHVEVQ